MRQKYNCIVNYYGEYQCIIDNIVMLDVDSVHSPVGTEEPEVRIGRICGRNLLFMSIIPLSVPKFVDYTEHEYHDECRDP